MIIIFEFNPAIQYKKELQATDFRPSKEMWKKNTCGLTWAKHSPPS
jgi:hypothetical protein